MERSAGQEIANIMRECFPDPSEGSFVLVADVGSHGKVAHVAVRPETPGSKCFALRFSALTLPEPPAEFRTHDMPIVIDMQVGP